MKTYKLRPQAELDLEAIWLYTTERWGVRQADRYIDEIDTCFHVIAHEPLIGRERTEFTPPVRIHRHSRHLIIYTVAAGDIFILRVLHEAMDIDDQLDQ